MVFSHQKHKLREYLRQKRHQFDDKEHANGLIVKKLYGFIQKQSHHISTVGLYYPVGNEASLLGFANAYAQKFSFYLPKVHIGKVNFIFWNQKDNLAVDELGILAPKSGDKDIPEIICVPLVGFTEKKDRIGQGGGYYDRFISQTRRNMMEKTIYIGIAFECQKIERLPIERHDQKLDFIITEKQIY